MFLRELSRERRHRALNSRAGGVFDCRLEFLYHLRDFAQVGSRERAACDAVARSRHSDRFQTGDVFCLQSLQGGERQAEEGF